MRELQLAGHPSIDPLRPFGAGGRAHFPLSRAAFVGSIAVHIAAGYALSRHEWPAAAPPQVPLAEFFLFEIPRPPPAVPEPVPVPESAPSPEARELPQPEPPPVAPRVVETAPPPPLVAPAELEPTPTVPVRILPSGADLADARQRAAEEVVAEAAAAAEAEREYLTFSIDDVAPPRPAAEPERKSIFDGAGEPIGPKVGQLGQARTKFGHRVSEICNALTGGFSLMGFGSFCAPPSDGEPSGLFPEVRPAYLDRMPECVDTRDTAPALALEAPFPTVKCRLVEQEDPGREP